MSFVVLILASITIFGIVCPLLISYPNDFLVVIGILLFAASTFLAPYFGVKLIKSFVNEINKNN